ncbi:MAG: NADH-quinone oxidoreductase subunit J [Bacteroidetes bacterium]|nr:NADH-quinone oxidoreductase subunit J [Bacteroidota bacterium]
MTSEIIFYFLAAVSVITALMVVFSKNPIYSVMWLIACFFSIAGHYVMLNAQFLAIVHIIVYAGAIMVLMLFTVMLLNLNRESEPHKSLLTKGIATVTGGMLFLVLLAAMRSTQLGAYASPEASDAGFVQKVGMVLFTDYLLPFEMTSVLFISAMIGAVVLAKKEKH